MALIQNVPLVSILLSLFAGPVSSVLDGKWAKRLNLFVITFIGILSAGLLSFVIGTDQEYVYTMGHFPAPWGNEIRVGVLEAAMALFFCIIMFLCVIGGVLEREREIEETKQNLYYIMVNLLLCSLLALIYTNDLFTAYVFVEINTISACGLIMIRQTGRTIEAATRYMIMSLLGSGLLLLGICFLYSLTTTLFRSDRASFDEQYQRTGDAAAGIGRISYTASDRNLPDVRRYRDQERAVSFSYMAAGRLRLFDAVVRGNPVFTCIKRVYFPARKDLLPGDRI